MLLHKNSSLLFVFLLLTIVLSACAFSSEERTDKTDNNARLDSLLELNDLSERAFVYHQYCLKDIEPINETFMDNFKVTSDMLLDEAVYEMGMSPEFVVERILSRRKMIQQQLGEYYHSKGCHSLEGQTALKHYRAFSQPRNY